MAMTAKALEIKKRIAELERQLEDEIDDELAAIRLAEARYRKAQNLWEAHFTIPRFKAALAAGFEFRRLGIRRQAARNRERDVWGFYDLARAISAGVRG